MRLPINTHHQLSDATMAEHRKTQCIAWLIGLAVILPVAPTDGSEPPDGAPVQRAASLESLTLPLEKRPEWLQREGIVMAGDWEALFVRARREGRMDYVPTPQQRAAYEREHTPEMIARLKALGVNFVMLHCYRGAGIQAERESMADAARFAKLCHQSGLHVGAYVDSGTLFWELMFTEKPSAGNWIVRDANGRPPTYHDQLYRYWRNRSHPEAETYYRQVVRFAVEEMQADLLHFDNYFSELGTEAESVQRFRGYLAATFSPTQLWQMGVARLDAVQGRPSLPKLLQYAWREFDTQSLTESYHRMSEYARSLRPDILIECNPRGPRRSMACVDHGRLLQGGEAFWAEGEFPIYSNGKLTTRIPIYKTARCTGNIAFTYTTSPLELAESMAFNLDCLGCVWYFEENGVPGHPICEYPTSRERAYIRFYNQRRDLFRGAEEVADVAVLHSFASQVLGGKEYSSLTTQTEDLLIDNRACYRVVYDHQLNDLKGCRSLVLAGCPALGEAQLKAIRRYVAAGGRLCVIGPVATHDQWMQPRQKPTLDDLPAAALIRAGRQDDWLAAIRRACGGEFSMSIQMPPEAPGGDSPSDNNLLASGKPETSRSDGLCAELTQQPGRRMVHLVNYRSDAPARSARVAVRLPPGRTAKRTTLVGPDHAAELPLVARQRGEVARFTVPEVGVYEIAVIEY
jgi:hypothetical protein